MGDPFILYEKTGRIVTVTMNRPEQMNAMNTAMGEDLLACFDGLQRDPDVRAVIATIGGHTCNAILPLIDYTALREQPTILVGYSDITALLLACVAKSDVVTREQVIDVLVAHPEVMQDLDAFSRGVEGESRVLSRGGVTEIHPGTDPRDHQAV